MNMNTPWIDPQSPAFRIQNEPKSFRTSILQLFSQSCSNVPKSEMLQGGDVSQWRGEMNWDAFFDNGMRYSIIRAMINGRPDTQYERNVRILTEQKRWFLCYGATGYPTLSNAIPYARAFADLVKGVPYLALWWDAEASGLLNPQEMAKYTSEVLGELSVLLPGTILEIYTRQTFWDSSVAAGNWSKYPLAAARYNEQLTCPWSDGRFEFRDWDAWRYWQISQCWDGAKYGAESRCIDGDYFNGNEEMFKEVYNIGEIPPPVDCCEENAEAIAGLYDQITVLSSRVDELGNQSHTHETEPPVEPPVEPPSGTIQVRIKEKHKAYRFFDDDDSCLPESEKGKPFMETDDDKEPFTAGQIFLCDAKLAWSCKDNPGTPTLIANGGRKYFRIAEEGTYKGRFIRQDKSMQV
jgi:GH25 family lysozyme M1 (1,4-beta-N-acetylmuramidase)